MSSPSSTSMALLNGYSASHTGPGLSISHGHGMNAADEWTVAVREPRSNTASDMALEQMQDLIQQCKQVLAPPASPIFASTMSFQSFKNAIDAQRLRDMPNEGSIWDKVLRNALVFGTTMDRFAKSAESFNPSTQTNVVVLWGCCRALSKVKRPVAQTARCRC